MKDFTWKGYFKDTLKNVGIDVTTMSEDDVALILEPTEAPECFYADGELKIDLAFTRWNNRMKNAGFSPDTIRKAIKFNFR